MGWLGPAVQPARVDEDLPGPRGERESQQGDEPVVIRYLAKDSMGGAGGDGFIGADPEAGGAEEGEHEAHGLEVEAGEEVAADVVGEAGGHATRGAGDASRVKEVTRLEVKEGKAGVGAGTSGVGGEVGG